MVRDRAQPDPRPRGRGVFTRVLRTDIRSTRVANQTFSVCLLNPPYDDNLVAVDEAAQRLELYFLQPRSATWLHGGCWSTSSPNGDSPERWPAPRLPLRKHPGLPLPCRRVRTVQTGRDLCDKKLKPFRDEAALAPIKAIARGTQIPRTFRQRWMRRFPFPW